MASEEHEVLASIILYKGTIIVCSYIHVYICYIMRYVSSSILVAY